MAEVDNHVGLLIDAMDKVNYIQSSKSFDDLHSISLNNYKFNPTKTNNAFLDLLLKAFENLTVPREDSVDSLYSLGRNTSSGNFTSTDSLSDVVAPSHKVVKAFESLTVKNLYGSDANLQHYFESNHTEEKKTRQFVSIFFVLLDQFLNNNEKESSFDREDFPKFC